MFGLNDFDHDDARWVVQEMHFADIGRLDDTFRVLTRDSVSRLGGVLSFFGRVSHTEAASTNNSRSSMA
jgi:hypothetical protein